MAQLSMSDPRRSVPGVDTVLADARLADAAERLGAGRVKMAVQDALERCRSGQLDAAAVVDRALDSLPASATSLRRVVNATGVIVHTNLGRAPLSRAVIDALAIAAGTTDVELDLANGRRGQRGRGALGALADAVPDAQAVHVVNNGAAALALVASGLGVGRTVVIARGELVEIGDGFRIPELLEAVGVRLREVGTTNRVRLADYEAAIDEDTAFVLKVHPSNFRITGFASSVSVGELATVPVPTVVDIGSGLLVPHPRLPDEPSASGALRAGAALVTASGDKLLGGPQCGLLLGRADLVETLRRNPFARAVRVDKLTLAAMEATLTGPPAPVPLALAADPADLMTRARAICAGLSGVLAADLTGALAGPLAGALAGALPGGSSSDARDGWQPHAVWSTAAVGGGGAPGVELASAAVALPAALAAPLRLGEPPVVGHVERGRLLLDLVAVDPTEDAVLVEAVRQAAKSVAGDGPNRAAPQD